MEQTPLQQASPVLHYAPKPPERRASRWVRAIVLALIGAVVVGIAGQIIRPVSYTSVGFLQVTPSSPAANVSQIQSQQGAAVAALGSPASLAAGVAAAKVNGVTLTPAQIQRNLNVVAVPQTKLVEVAHSSSNSALAATIVNGIMNNAVSTSTSTVTIASPAPAAIAVHATPLFTASLAMLGAIAGFGAGWFWRRR